MYAYVYLSKCVCVCVCTRERARNNVNNLRARPLSPAALSGKTGKLYDRGAREGPSVGSVCPGIRASQQRRARAVTVRRRRR